MEWTLPLLLLLTGGHCGNVELNIVPQPVTVGKEVVMACISPTLNKWGAKWYMDGSLVYEVHSKQGGCSEKGQILDFKIKTCNPNTGVFKITKLNVTATLNNTIWHCGFPDEGNSSVETILVQNQPIVNLTITPRTVTEGSNLNMSCSSNKENDGVADWYIHDRLVLKSENKVDGCFVELTNEIAFKHLVTCLITENKIVLTIQNVPATLNNTRWHCDMNENQPSKKILLIISRQPQAFLNVSKRTVDFGGHVNLTCRYSAELAAEKITWTRNNITVTELRSSGENGCTGTPLDADFELKAHCSLNSTKFTLEIFDVRVVLNDTTWMCVIEGVDKSKAVSNIVRIYVNKEWTAVQVTETTQESTTSNYTQEMGLAGSSSPSYLIPVLVGLGVFILVVAAAATVVGYKRRAKPGAAGAAKQKQDDNVNQPSNKESLVMQENELYCSSDNLTTDAVQLTQLKDGEGEMPDNYRQDDNVIQPSNKESLVMQENELYCSSDNLTTDAVQLTQLKDGEGEMPDNYRQYDNANQPSNKESLVMQENELYCSSDNLTTDAVQLTQLKDEEGEMPDNYSSVSTSDSKKLDKSHKDSLVLQDNCLYESSEY